MKDTNVIPKDSGKTQHERQARKVVLHIHIQCVCNTVRTAGNTGIANKNHLETPYRTQREIRDGEE